MSTKDKNWPCTVKGCTRNNRACMRMIDIDSSKEPSEKVKFLETDLGTMCEDVVKYYNAELTRHEMVDGAKSSVNQVESVNEWTPKKIAARLREYVRGQDDAVNSIATAVYSYLIVQQMRGNKELLKEFDLKANKLSKPNIFAPGPTGSGKTYIAELLGEMLGIPVLVYSVASVTSSGYVGASVSDIGKTLIQKVSEFMLSKDGKEPDPEAVIEFINTKGAITVLDEIDKKAAGGSGRDVSGEDVQNELLTFIQGQELAVNLGSPVQPMEVILDTENIMFIVAGAFMPAGSGGGDGEAQRKSIKQMVEDERSGGGGSFDNGSNIAQEAQDGTDKKSSDYLKRSYFSRATEDHFTKFGLKPEFVGRFGFRANFNELSEDDLFYILTEVRNNPVAVKKAAYRVMGFELDIDEKALREVARRAASKPTGARALTKILEELFAKVALEAPDLAGEYNTVYISAEMTKTGKGREFGDIIEKGENATFQNREAKTKIVTDVSEGTDE